MESKTYPHLIKNQTIMAPIVALIVDDHPISADGMRSYLETTQDIQVADICYDGEHALEAVALHHPDIVIVDLQLDGSRIDGIEVARQLRHSYPSLKLLVVSAYADPQFVLGAVSAGVDGYLIKTSSNEEIIQAIYDVMRGVKIWDPRAHKVIRLYIGDNIDKFTRFAQNHFETTPENLTKREVDVLKLVAAGYSNQEISHNLVITEGTVKTHVSHILEKLNLEDRGQARVWYYINRHHYE